MASREIDDAELESIMLSRREKLRLDRDAKQQELDDIDKNIRRIEGYLNPAGPLPASKARTPSGPRAQRGELGGFRKEVYDFVAQHPTGLEAGEVQAHFNPHKDKSSGRRSAPHSTNLRT